MIRQTQPPAYDPKGLSEQEAIESRRAHGDNVITPPAEESAWKLLAEKFRDPIIRVLLVAAALSLAIACVEGNFTEPVGILCAIVLATGVGFWFERDAMQRFRRLNRVNDDIPVKVARDGSIREIPRRDVVVGDVIHIESGDTVPADGILVEAVSLHVDESTLTGEPETGKTADPAHFDPEATYPSNAMLRGTVVTDGYGVFVATAVGDASEAGRVTEQASVANDEPTPLDRQLTRLSHLIGKAGIALAAAIFAVMLVKSYLAGSLSDGSWLETSQEVLHIFMVSVAIIVMAVPEGLPMSITLSLAMSMRRMLRTNNLVRKMHACETMGAVTVICTDKTGTLTRNRMSVSAVEHYDDLAPKAFAELIAANSTAFLDRDGGVVGNPTEGALLDWLSHRGEAYAALREGAQIVDRLTFSTERKYMATIIESGISHRRLLLVKGAPEIVRRLCVPDARDAQIERQLLGYQNRGMRTLAFAWAETTAARCDEAVAQGGLRFSAVAAIADPVREDVPEAVKRCLDAGIAVRIVTGDTTATAREIAREIGLWDDACDRDASCCTAGGDFESLPEADAERCAGSIRIMSRARPLQKHRLVRMLQKRGEVVAVTGDGTNDAPALKSADVGLSMGSGTAVAKEASDITLLDDSFASIATAVMWGRSLYRNIQRFVLFQLTINFAAIVICFVGALIGKELPLTVVQILWVNIIMDTFAAMAMASLPPDPEVMRDKPRSRDESIITPAIARTIFACGAVIIAVLLGMLCRWTVSGGLDERRLTIFFSTFVFLQFWNMFNARGFETRHSVFGFWKGCREFFLTLAAIAVGQVLIVEFGGEVFRTVPLAAGEWLRIIGFTSLLALGGEAVRAWRRHRNRSGARTQ